MATNELPEKPSDEDFEAARDWVQRTLPCDELAAQRVLRYLLALHDAKPKPVVEWRSETSPWRNTRWTAYVDSEFKGTVYPEARGDALMWIWSRRPHCEYPTVGAAKLAVERELCGVSTKTGTTKKAET